MSDVRDMIRMVEEGHAYCDSIGEERVIPQEYLDSLKAKLATAGASREDAFRVDGAARPTAGSPASNQYGTFQVHYATPKQTAFIGSLLERKDLSSIETSKVLDIARLREQVAANQINKKAASDIIDRLLALPDAVTTAVPSQANLATEKQQAFVSRLLAERGIDPAYNVNEMSKSQASSEIERLLAMPKAAPTAKNEVEAGVYVNPDGRIFRVYLGQQSGRMLAALAIKHENGTAEFDYQGQAERFVTASSRKMSIEEAAAWGKATGTCIVCARRLDVPESVDRGIGPVCYAKMGGM